ncbi:MAG TPA: exopolysaccharide biosynthesis polyprenyl glycosylphosphotransferase [Anaerolineae bacterium]|nr:exopolysaccharide biosynthesis polyprenyl glycosylphosphotransferase [Anaerolineae bacterium]
MGNGKQVTSNEQRETSNQYVSTRPRPLSPPVGPWARRTLLALVDYASLTLAVVAALRLRGKQPTQGWPASLLLLALVWWLVAALGATYNIREVAHPYKAVLSVARAILIAVPIYVLLPGAVPAALRQDLTWGVALLLALAALILWRVIYTIVVPQPRFVTQVLVVGDGRLAQLLVDAVKECPQAGYRLTGMVETAGESLPVELPRLGGTDAVLDMAQSGAVDEIALAFPHGGELPGTLFQTLMECRGLGISITSLPLLYELLTGRVPVERVKGELRVLLPLDFVDSGPAYRMARRLMDILLSLPGLLLLGLLAPPVAFANALLSPGPLFHSQMRVGLHGRPFRLHKFRTMIPGAERETGAVWADTHDPRVTRVGRWLRRTHLDELPQLINVLRGEMSLVGPRPERPEFVAQLTDQIPFYPVRHAVRPGLTGWAQVKFRYGRSVEDALTKLQYDLFYLRHQSFYFDLLIVLKTVGIVFGRSCWAKVS